MEKAPPTYTSSVEAHDNILSNAATVLRAEKSSTLLGDACPSSVERLRNFLCYILYVDYEAGTPKAIVSLSAADANHFRTVASDYWRFMSTLGGTTVEEGERIFMGTYFWDNVYAPSQALGLPAEVTLSCLTRFNYYQTCEGAYKGCIMGDMQRYGFPRVAGKLLQDRNTVIPRIAPNVVTEEALIEGLERVKRRWFESFDGFNYEAGRRLEMEGGRWYHSDFNAFEMTTEAMAVSARMQESLKLKMREQEQYRTRMSEARRFLEGVRDERDWLSEEAVSHVSGCNCSRQTQKTRAPDKQQDNGQGLRSAIVIGTRKCLARLEQKAYLNRVHTWFKWPQPYPRPQAEVAASRQAIFKPVCYGTPNFFTHVGPAEGDL